MPLDFHMIKGLRGALQPSEIECSINDKDHQVLFRHTGAKCGGFSEWPHISEYDKDAFYGNGTLRSLVGEIETMNQSISHIGAVRKFLGSLRELCGLALTQGNDIAALAD